MDIIHILDFTKSASPMSAKTTPIAPVAMQQRRVWPDPQHPAAISNQIRKCKFQNEHKSSISSKRLYFVSCFKRRIRSDYFIRISPPWQQSYRKGTKCVYGGLYGGYPPKRQIP